VIVVLGIQGDAADAKEVYTVGLIAVQRRRPSAALSADHNGEYAEALRSAHLILAPVPAFAQGELAAVLAPHVADGQTILLPPGTFGSYLMTKVLRAKG
jgi:opine dehydrogenase